jgi:hypothetical protein
MRPSGSVALASRVARREAAATPATPRKHPGEGSSGYDQGVRDFHPSRSLLLLAVIGASLLLPGVAHLRLGAGVQGVGFLSVTAVLSVVQFTAPFVERPSIAVLFSGSAFAVGWLVSLVAARSAARFVHAGRV